MIKIIPYQLDVKKLQAEASYKVGKKLMRKRWLIPESIYIGKYGNAKDRACQNWAQNKLVEVLAEAEKKEIRPATTVSAFYPRWVEWLSHEVKPMTANNYERTFVNHILPFWGKKEVKDLSDAGLMIDYKTYLMNKTQAKKGSKGKVRTLNYIGKDVKLSISSTNNIQVALNSVCELAHDLHLIDYKPKTKFGKREKTDITDKKYSIEQQEIILESAKNISKVAYAIVLLGLRCGFRRGEVCALQWANVFFDDNYIDVKYNLNVIKGKVNIGTPKGGNSEKVAMGQQMLLALNSIQPANATGLVFRLMPWEINNLTRKILKAAHQIDKTIVISANFHKFRHNCASNLGDKDFYVVKIKDHLRHSDINTTMIYIHTGSIKETGAMLDSISSPGEKEKLKSVK